MIGTNVGFRHALFVCIAYFRKRMRMVHELELTTTFDSEMHTKHVQKTQTTNRENNPFE